MEIPIGLNEALITLFTLGVGWVLKHAVDAFPNRFIPVVAVVGPVVLAFAADQLIGMNFSHPLMAAVMGSLAIAIQSGTKHAFAPA
jgi:hypothetical protein|tara:strand:- start:510 stop:767 length:258 start_codon:yes stop_codon:yes gene_type:complete